MKVRTKFTLWIALTSLLAALLFSIFVYTELVEEPHNLMKRELVDISEAVLKKVNLQEKKHFSPENIDYPLERFFVKLLLDEATILYQSPLANQVDITPGEKDGLYTISRDISPNTLWWDPLEFDDDDKLDGKKTRFKLLQKSKVIGGSRITVIVAKPLAMLSAELKELLHELLLYIAITVVVIVAISYLLAGKFLEPISKINARIKTIRETSLDERIPLGESKDELYQLTVSLNSMFDRLSHSFERQKEFISSASHELKIPLTVTILGHEELLSRRLPDPVREDLTKQLYTLQRLNKLVKDLLDISHLEHKEYINRSSLELEPLIARVLGDFAEMFSAANIICTTDIEKVTIHADKDKIARVFVNLFDNAIKYNLPENGHIHLSVTKISQQVKIIITNSSVTISKEDLAELFKQFYRVEKSRASQFGGSGLGLTIVQRIVELHGGSISVRSQDGETEFIILLELQ